MNKEVMDPDDIRGRVQGLRTFYTNITIYGAVLLLCVLVWLCMGGGPFWPIWVAIGCGTAAFLEASRLDQLPFLKEYLPFLSQDWEEKQKEKLQKKLKTKDDL